jgi:ATP synthase protein I
MQDERELNELQQQELKPLSDMDDEQLEALNEKIISAKSKGKKSEDLSGQAKAQQTGMRAGSEFIGIIIGSGVVGYFIDKFLDTTPFLMILILLLGFGYGIYRAYSVMNDD